MICIRTPTIPTTTHSPVFITDERSSCFNFFCCFLTASFPQPHRSFPVPSPPPFFLSFLVYFGETTPLPDPSCCSFLDDCSYFLSPRERPHNGLVSVYLYSRVFFCYARGLTRSHAPPPFYLLLCLCSECTVLLSLSVRPAPAHFLFSHRVSLPPACNSRPFLHNLQRLHLTIDHVHLHTIATTMHSPYTFGYLFWSLLDVHLL